MSITTVPSHLATFTADGSGAIKRDLKDKLSDVVSVKDFGAVGDGVADDTAAIDLWITYLMSTGEKGTAPAGVYFMASPLTIDVTGDVDIHVSDKAVFKGGSAISQVMILFHAPNRETHQVSWRGGTFDHSETVFIPSDLSGGGLGIQKIWKCVVEGVRFQAAVDYETGGGFGGDTGLTIVDCRFVSVANCFFSGQRDLGIYITGDSSSLALGDGGDISVVNNHFYKCAGGISAKQQTQRTLIDGNTFSYCYRGVMLVCTDVVAPDPPGGRRAIISNNSFSYIAKNPIWVQYGGDGGTIITGNRIQDFGIALDGITPVSSPTGMLLEGTSHNLITGNWVGLQDWAVAGSHCGVLMQDFTYDGTVYDCEYNTVSDNYFLTLDIGCRETPGEADYNKYQCNTFRNVTETYNSIQANSSTFEQDFGTWTVTLYDAATGGNASPTTVTGQWVKTGRLITAYFGVNDILTTGMTGANLLYVSLPFPAKVGGAGSVVTDNITFPSGRSAPTLTVSAGGSRALISTSGTGVSDSAILVSNLNSGVSDIASAIITYQV